MEESPHKCPVCSRSFNQRSNLKTHLLTHTDHKPYECTSCGKVFRRNCDLRRHTLTHAVGDVPTEVLDVGEEEQRHLSGDEDDSVLEVDSPNHSPMRRLRSPSPSSGAAKSHSYLSLSSVKDEDNEENDDNIEENETNLKDSSGITHCHHQGANGSHSPYTMRPSQEKEKEREREREREKERAEKECYRSMLAMHQSQPSTSKLSISMSSETFVPMLHVRRDLHHKSSNATITSNVLEHPPSFLGSMPIRKRPIGPDGEPHPIIGRYSHHITHHPLSLTKPHTLLKPPDDLILPTIIPSEPNIEPLVLHQTLPPPPPPNSSILSPSLPLPQIGLLSNPQPSTSSSVPQQQQQSIHQPPPQPQPPRKTGFSIEEIMRR